MFGKKKMPSAKKMAMFEKSGKDVDPKGMKEGSPADVALDQQQMAGMKRGGKVKKMAAGGTVQKGGMAQRGWGAAKGGMKRGGKC